MAVLAVLVVCLEVCPVECQVDFPVVPVDHTQALVVVLVQLLR
jgi:hypothetical protein